MWALGSAGRCLLISRLKEAGFDSCTRHPVASRRPQSGVAPPLTPARPETLNGDPLRAALAKCPRVVALLAVDEAHCISSCVPTRRRAGLSVPDCSLRGFH